MCDGKVDLDFFEGNYIEVVSNDAQMGSRVIFAQDPQIDDGMCLIVGDSKRFLREEDAWALLHRLEAWCETRDFNAKNIEMS